MAWSGYFRLGDREIINGQRTKVYSRALGLHFVKDVTSNDDLSSMLGDSPYVSPAVDNAPWYDPDIPESAGFAGLIPIEVTGIEDSSRESKVFEYTSDGGNPGRLRHGTKEVVFSVALVGDSDGACEYGFRWLKRALMRRQCAPGSTIACKGERLYYSRSMPSATISQDALCLNGGADGGTATSTYPELDGGYAFVTPDASIAVNSAQWKKDYERFLSDVLFSNGPKVTGKRTVTGCQGAVWMVSFTATVGPYEHGSEVPVLAALGGAGDPYAPGVTGSWGSATYEYANCGSTTVADPLFDPTAPALVSPPTVPNVTPTQFVIPAGTQQRRHAIIPASLIPEWDEVRPVVTLRTGGTEARMLRVRIYDATLAADANCGQVGEFVVSYIPANYSLVIDTSQSAVLARANDQAYYRRADSLVFGSLSAQPIKWFGLSCGEAYRIALDWDGDTAPGVTLELDLVPRSA